MSWRLKWAALALAAAVAVGWGWSRAAAAPESAVQIPLPAMDNPKASGPLQKAVLAGGCFWGVQGVFQHVQGVRGAVSGYAGGDKQTAEYEIVSTGRTAHAETVEVTFDPKEISYGQILQIYFSVVHDPTQLNRQDPDVGPQYRSNIFYTTDAQKKIAEAYIAQLNKAKVYAKPIVTRVDPLQAFYAAEDYHQDFLVRNPTQGYIARFDIPRVQNLKAVFPVLYRGQPVLVRGVR